MVNSCIGLSLVAKTSEGSPLRHSVGIPAFRSFNEGQVTNFQQLFVNGFIVSLKTLPVWCSFTNETLSAGEYPLFERS